MKNFQQFDGAYGKFLKIKTGAGNQVRTGDLNLGRVLPYQVKEINLFFKSSHLPFELLELFQVDL